MIPFSQIIFEDDVGLNSSIFRSSSSSLYSPDKLVTYYHSAKIIIRKESGLNGNAIIARSKIISLG